MIRTFSPEEIEHVRTFGAQVPPNRRATYVEQVAEMLRSLGRECGPADVHRAARLAARNPMPGLLRRQGLSARLNYSPNYSCLTPKPLIVSCYTWNGRRRPSGASRNQSGSRLDESKRRRH
jgi:hypothetical protein